MAAGYAWDNPDKDVIRYILVTPWEWEQFHQVLDDTRAEIRTFPHRVDVIVDMRESHKLPPDSMANLRLVASRRPPNAGIIVAVGAGSLVLNLYKAFQKVYAAIDRKLSIHFTATLEEAREIVAAEREKDHIG